MSPDPLALTLDDVLAETGALRSLARRLLGDEHAAEDALVHAAERAVQAQPGRRSLAAYLRRVLRTRAIDQARRTTARSRAERSVGPAPEVPSAAAMAEACEARRLVADAVLVLPPLLREIVWLHYYEGLSAADTAARLNVPAATAKSRLRRALAELRAELTRRTPNWRAALAPFASLRPPASRLPWFLGLALAAVAALVAFVSLRSVVSVTPTADFAWLADVGEVWVQVPRDGSVERLRYARVLPTSTFAHDAVNLLWDRDGTLGEDRFELDARTGEWRVRLGSLATAPAVEFRGRDALLEGEGLRLRWVDTPAGRAAVIERPAEAGGWRVVERAVFRPKG